MAIRNVQIRLEPSEYDALDERRKAEGFGSVPELVALLVKRELGSNVPFNSGIQLVLERLDSLAARTSIHEAFPTKDQAQASKIPDVLPPEAGIISSYPPNLQKWFALLETILTSNVPQVVDAIKSNLVAFELAVRNLEPTLGKTGNTGVATTEDLHARMDRVLAHAQAIERDIETFERLIREARTPKQRDGRTRKRSGGAKGSNHSET